MILSSGGAICVLPPTRTFQMESFYASVILFYSRSEVGSKKGIE